MKTISLVRSTCSKDGWERREAKHPSETHQVAAFLAREKDKDYLEDYEQKRIAAAWQESGEDYQAAAKILGISPQLMRYKIKKFFYKRNFLYKHRRIRPVFL